MPQFFFPPFNLPDDIILLITDELSAPADFVLHRTLAAHLKRPIQRNASFDHAQIKPRAVILSVSGDLGRWKALALRSNINIQNHLDSGSVIFMDLLAGLQPPHSQQQLQVIFDRVQQKISRDHTNVTPRLLILDDITTLEWVGCPPTDVQHFIRALRALCLKTKTTLLIRHHRISSSDGELDDLLRLLLQICTYHLEVRSLASGRSGAVTGEMSLHRGLSAPSAGVKLINRNSALQYRLTDTGLDVFAKGTSAGVL